jgi:hypothetical protein
MAVRRLIADHEDRVQESRSMRANSALCGLAGEAE